MKEKSVIGLFTRALNFVYKKGYIYKISLENLSLMHGESFEFKKMSLLNLEQIHKTYSSEFSSDKFKIISKRLHQSDNEIPYIVFYNNNIAGYYHIAYKDNFDTTLKIPAINDKNNIHLFDDYTFKAFRGKGVHKFSICSRLKLGKSKGYKTASVHILKGNKFSEKAYVRLGFYKVMEVTVWFNLIKQIKSLEL
ncbi:MAG: GNAT family N-acetyltransferase [Bacteroidales bacterium]